MDQREPEDQQGYFLVFIAIGITIFIGMLSMAINVSYSRSLRTEMQDAVDSAAHAAASILCSTNACFEDALGIAITMLEEKTSEGIIKSGVEMDPADGTFSWTNGTTTITIHRGRWWPKGSSGYTNIPYSGTTGFFHDNGQFEDFDREIPDLSSGESVSWQEAYPQLPDFLVSNAVYIKAEVEYENSFFNIFNISKSTLTTEAYAVAGDADEEVCVAPFALSVCSLLNNFGEYNKDKACLYERYFTEENRYCDKDDDGNVTECSLVPGSLYRAFPKNPPENQSVDANTTLVLNEDNPVNFSVTGCNCPSGPAGSLCRFNCGKPGGQTPVTDYLEVKMNFTCDFKSSVNPLPEATDPAEIESPADFFGLVGMPVKSGETLTPSGLNPGALTSYETVLNNIANFPGGYCLGAKIGDDFKVLEDGLASTAAASKFKEVLNSSNVQNGYFGDTFDVIYHSLLTRNPDLLPTHNGSSPDLQAKHAELECSEKVPNTRHGICNSQLFRYDTRCLEKQGMTSVSESNSTYIGDVLYSENMIACPNDETINQVFAASNINEHKIWDPTTFLTSNEKARTWTVAVPIIAPKDANDMDHACAGILSKSAPDPIFKVGTPYTIVGFTEVIFYDHDIAETPPTRGFKPRDSDSQVMKDDYEANKVTYELKEQYWKDNLWSDDEMYWGFQDDEVDTLGETPVMCNMIKGAQTCNPGLLSAPQTVTQHQRKVTIAVPF